VEERRREERRGEEREGEERRGGASQAASLRCSAHGMNQWKHGDSHQDARPFVIGIMIGKYNLERGLCTVALGEGGRLPAAAVDALVAGGKLLLLGHSIKSSGRRVGGKNLWQECKDSGRF
jgi:hypothetical protein